MKHLDVKSIIIGALCAALVFVSLGASSDGNLEHLRVKSVTIVNDSGKNVVKLAYNKGGNGFCILGTSDGETGLISLDSENAWINVQGTSGPGYSKRHHSIGMGIATIPGTNDTDGLLKIGSTPVVYLKKSSPW